MNPHPRRKPRRRGPGRPHGVFPTYGSFGLSATEVILVRPDLTVEEAEAFLRRRELDLHQGLAEAGWGVLEIALLGDPLLPEEPADLEAQRQDGRSRLLREIRDRGGRR